MTGRRYPHRRQVGLSEEQGELLRRLAQRWRCPQADVIRKLIVEAGDREGLMETATRPLSPEERAARANAAFGIAAHLPGSVDDFLRRKQEDIDLEEERWQRRRSETS